MSDEQYKRDVRDEYGAHWAPDADAPGLSNHANNHASQHGSDEPDAIPNELHGVYSRLLTDGAAWSATTVAAPDTLIRYAQTLPQLEPRTRAEQSAQSLTAQKPLAVEEAPAAIPRPPQSAQPLQHHTGDMRRGARWPRVVWAPVAVVVIVALVVAVFYGFAIRFRGPTVGTTPPKTATVPGVHGKWTNLTALDYTTAYQQFLSPVVAASDPQVVYEPQVKDAHNLSSATLRRTDDSGKTWHALALPISGDALYAIGGIAVSPLDAHTVILSIARADLLRCPTGVDSQLAINHPLTICYVQYISQDGGASWRQLNLPVAGLLAQIGQFGSGLFPLMVNPFYSQGNDLYAMAAGGYPPVTEFPRLLMSNDGGLTWRMIDAALNVGLTSQNDLCAFAPTPTGTTVFAVTTSAQQDCVPEGIFTLWRSDDTGAHWRQVSTLPAQTFDGLFVSAQSDAAPILYADFPQVISVAGGLETNETAHDLNMSADGGLTWTPIATTSSLPHDIASAGTRYSLPFPWKDGGVIRGYGVGQGGASQMFFAWTPATRRWQAITPPVVGSINDIVTFGGRAITLISSNVASGTGGNQPVTFTFWRYVF